MQFTEVNKNHNYLSDIAYTIYGDEETIYELPEYNTYLGWMCDGLAIEYTTNWRANARSVYSQIDERDDNRHLSNQLRQILHRHNINPRKMRKFPPAVSRQARRPIYVDMRSPMLVFDES